jgi:hypothetical protein
MPESLDDIAAHSKQQAWHPARKSPGRGRWLQFSAWLHATAVGLLLSALARHLLVLILAWRGDWAESDYWAARARLPLAVSLLWFYAPLGYVCAQAFRPLGTRGAEYGRTHAQAQGRAARERAVLWFVAGAWAMGHGLSQRLQVVLENQTPGDALVAAHERLAAVGLAGVPWNALAAIAGGSAFSLALGYEVVQLASGRRPGDEVSEQPWAVAVPPLLVLLVGAVIVAYATV